MIITTNEELRLYIPNHAIDDIKAMAGYFDASEHDTLIEKIGRELYDKVIEYYQTFNNDEFVEKIAQSTLTGYYDKLVQMCQRIVAFDAMKSMVGTMTLSVNGAGINVPTADDYGKTDKDSLSEFKAACNTNLHKSINVLLQTLEEWVIEYNNGQTDNTEEATTEQTEQTEESDSSDSSVVDETLAEIVTLWQKSRYYYLTATLVVPCATILQEYLNFYENREKFIQMLPDLKYIQEDILADRIGEELVDWFVSQANAGTEDTTVIRCIDKLRKTTALLLEARTNVLSTTKERQMKAHDEALAMLEKCAEYIEVRQTSLPDSAQDALKLSPLYKQTEDSTPAGYYEPKFRNNESGNAIFVMPGMN